MAVKFNLQQLKHLEKWPTGWRYIVPGVVFLLVLGVAHWLLIDHVNQQISSLKSQENLLKNTLDTKQSQAALLPVYQQQVNEINQTFSNLALQLPSIAPTSQVLDDISKVGDASGVGFGLIKPMPELAHGFYVELPIQMTVSGSYQQLGQFISGLTALSRIISVGDFTIMPAMSDAGKTQNTLIMNLQVSAYRYIEGQSDAKP